MMDATQQIHDIVIIGAGPAGLTAATYLGRFRRPCLVLEDDESRARWIPTSHNIPGFAAGIGGAAFLATLRQQSAQYGSHIRRARVAVAALQDAVFHLTLQFWRKHSPIRRPRCPGCTRRAT